LASFFIRLLDGASYAGTRVPNLGKPLPARFENPEPVHRFTGKIFLKPGNYPVSVNRATALVLSRAVARTMVVDIMVPSHSVITYKVP
jgi:hypothetical protein